MPNIQTSLVAVNVMLSNPPQQRMPLLVAQMEPETLSHSLRSLLAGLLTPEVLTAAQDLVLLNNMV